MANDKRFIVKNGLRSQNVEFTDSQDGSNQITLNMLNTDTLNFEGDAGSLFSISDDLTGTVFSVGDISGIPIMEVIGGTHNVTFNEFDGKVMIGGTDSGGTDSDVLNVTGNVRATAYYGDGSNLSGIAASGGVDSAAVSSIITADVDNAFVDALNANAATVTATANNTNNETVYLTFVDGATGQQGIETDTALSYNPSSNTLAAGVFSGSGASLSSLNASNLSSGTVSDARLPASISSDITGNAFTATILATARNIGGVSFNGGSNISLPGVNITGNQDTSGNAATATALATGRNIDLTGVTATAQSFDGTGDISIPVTAVPASLLTGTISDARLPASISSDITGNAASADSATSAGSAVQAENADRLDNISSGSFLRSDAADAFSGKLDATGTIEFAGGTTFDPSGGGTGTDTATDVGIALKSGTRIVGTNDGYIRNLLDWTSGSTLQIGQSGTALIDHVKIFGGAQGVELYENGTKRIETTSTGASVTGDLTLTSTDAGATESPTLKLFRNSATPAASDNIGNIQFTGNNASGTEVVLAEIEAVLGGTTAGSEEGRMRLKVNDGGTEFTVIEIGYDRVQFNEGIFINYGNGINFEGSNFDDFETSLIPTEPTQDNTITLPDATGTVLLTDGDGSSLTSVDAETLDGVNSTSFLRSDASDNYTSGTLTFNSGTQLKLTSNGGIPALDIDGGGPNFIRFTDNSSTTDAVNIVYRTFPKDLRIERSTNDNIIAEFGGDDGHAALFYDNSKKLETVTGGVTVTGTVTATAFSGDGSALTGIDAGSSVTVSLDAPSSPSSGDLWYDAEFGNLLIYYDDSDTNQWVTTNAPSLADSSISSNKFINAVSLTIYDSSGSAIKTLYSPDR